MPFPANLFARPDFGSLLGFLGQKGTQAVHLIGLRQDWPLYSQD